jgi:MFS family permease
VQQQPAHSPRERVPDVPAQPTSSLAVASLVAGIGCWTILPVIAAVAAIITGHIARRRIRRTGESGGGMALAGLILGYAHLAVVAAVAAFVAIFLVIFGAAILQAQPH